MWATEAEVRPGRSAAQILALILPSVLRFVLPAVLGHGAWAQPTSPVTDADMRRAQQLRPVITERDIEDARRRHGSLPPDLPAPTTGRSAPSIDTLPRPLSAPLDLNAVAEGFRVTEGAATLPRSGPTLLVFASLSMPEPSLRRLAEQSSRAGASVHLRGLHGGSLPATVQAVHRLGGGGALPIRIDPQAFDRYAIGSVPSFVLVEQSEPVACERSSCPAAGGHVKASGDVSLDHALRQLARSSPAAAKAAAPFLRRLEGSR